MEVFFLSLFGWSGSTSHPSCWSSSIPNTTRAEGEKPAITSSDTSDISEPSSEPTNSHIEPDKRISALKRQLEDCSLAVAKRRAGRPRTKKALDHRRFFHKTFLEKALEEQAKNNMSEIF